MFPHFPIAMSEELDRRLRLMERNLQKASEDARAAEERARQLEQQMAAITVSAGGSATAAAADHVSREEPDFSRMSGMLSKFTGGYSDGHTFSEWIRRFEEIARARKWEGDRRAQILPTFLDGQALLAYRRLDDAVQNSYDAVKAALANRLEPVVSTEFYAAKLHSPRRQSENEDVSAFAAEIERLTQGAYPVTDTFPSTAQNLQMRNCFVSGLKRDLQLEVLGKSTGTFEEAVRAALTREAHISLLEGHMRPAAKGDTAQLFGLDSERKFFNSDSRSQSDWQKRKFARPNETDRRSQGVQMKRRLQGGQNSAQIECYYCRKRGHFQNVCYKKQRDQQRGQHGPTGPNFVQSPPWQRDQDQRQRARTAGRRQMYRNNNNGHAFTMHTPQNNYTELTQRLGRIEEALTHHTTPAIEKPTPQLQITDGKPEGEALKQFEENRVGYSWMYQAPSECNDHTDQDFKEISMSCKQQLKCASGHPLSFYNGGHIVNCSDSKCKTTAFCGVCAHHDLDHECQSMEAIQDDQPTVGECHVGDAEEVQVDPEVVLDDVTFQCQVLSESAILPQRATDGSVGYDLATAKHYSIPPHGSKKCDTDLAIRPPEGTFAKIEARSSFAMMGITVEAGIVDPDYTGKIGVLLYNHTNRPFHVKPG
ncbi:MAG: hypothetical protein GY820_02585, partial [Gammaproteobacteria bacterium]|nr:hypothetical protein [Gammaproteobacteria bacterium]